MLGYQDTRTLGQGHSDTRILEYSETRILQTGESFVLTMIRGVVQRLCGCACSRAPLVILHMRKVKRPDVFYQDFTTATLLGVHLLNAQELACGQCV